LRLLAGLVGLSAGEAGSSVWTSRPSIADNTPSRRWLGHEGSFYDDLSVAENLTFAAKALGRPTDELTTVLDRVELTARRDIAASNSRPVNGDDSAGLAAPASSRTVAARRALRLTG